MSTDDRLTMRLYADEVARRAEQKIADNIQAQSTHDIRSRADDVPSESIPPAGGVSP